jgi:DNA-binding transcriptional MerR regulator
MLKIGRFARLAGVSVTTLRFYASTGLLRPAHVAEGSGYRYYHPSQLSALRRIRWLRELDCSIAEIRALTAAAEGSAEQAHQLHLLRRRLMLRLALDEQRLKRLDVLLDAVRRAAADCPAPIAQRRIAAVAVLTVRERVRSPGHVERMFEATERRVARHGLRAPRSPFLLLHDMDYRALYPDVEVCVPVVPESVSVCGGRVIAAVERAACTRFSGAYAQAPLIYDRLLEWMSGSGTRIAGAVREVYLRYGADQRGYRLPSRVLARSEAEYRTELQVPLARA